MPAARPYPARVSPVAPSRPPCAADQLSGVLAGTGVPGTLITNDKVRVQDPSKLTPDAVAAYQQKWKSLFQ